MSFREIRNFTECMRSLGYPRIVSVENFRTPNFELVADCLEWLAQRYDGGAVVEDDISTETDRVRFLKSVAAVFLSKARIKLNLKRLYAADGLAVKELLKIANLLYQATAKADEDDADEEASGGTAFALDASAFDVKTTRALASEITRLGATLHDALGEEERLRDARLSATRKNMDIEEIESQISEQIATVRENAANVERAMAELTEDESSLARQIERKRAELERSEKRLATLESVRPAYMDEYERLEPEMDELHAAYIERHRNLTYLESELEKIERDEEDAAAAHAAELDAMRGKLRAEELRVLRGEERADEDVLLRDDFATRGGGAGPGAKKAAGDSRAGASRRAAPAAAPAPARGRGAGAAAGRGDRFGGGAGGRGRQDSRVVGSLVGGRDDSSDDDPFDDASGSSEDSSDDSGF